VFYGGRVPASLRPLLAATITVLLWASAFVAIRHVGADFSPGALSLGRLLVGSVVLGAALLRSGHVPLPRELWPRLLVCGVLWFGVYNVALNAAERRVDAGTAALLVNVGPILITLLAGLLLGEGYPRTLLLGGGVAFGGVIVIGLATSHGAGSDLAGVVLCLVAAVAYAGGVVSQKPLLGRLSALQVTWSACTIGAVACLPYLPALIRGLGSAPASSSGWLVYLGVFPTAVAFTTWAYALARTSAGRMGATTYLVPPVAILLSWLLLGETPPALALLGGVLCLVGVSLTRRPSRATPRGPRPRPEAGFSRPRP
jgi:drug/metabolite transporter (DMT)-like permease